MKIDVSKIQAYAENRAQEEMYAIYPQYRAPDSPAPKSVNRSYIALIKKYYKEELKAQLTKALGSAKRREEVMHWIFSSGVTSLWRQVSAGTLENDCWWLSHCNQEMQSMVNTFVKD